VTAIEALDDWVGPGYSLPSQEMIEAVRMLARIEGILLDPVLRERLWRAIGLIRRVNSKRRTHTIRAHRRVTALYAYQSILL